MFSSTPTEYFDADVIVPACKAGTIDLKEPIRIICDFPDLREYPFAEVHVAVASEEEIADARALLHPDTLLVVSVCGGIKLSKLDFEEPVKPRHNTVFDYGYYSYDDDIRGLTLQECFAALDPSPNHWFVPSERFSVCA